MKWVSFPKLGIDKIFFKDYAFLLFGLKIKWYAIIICFGILVALLFSFFLAKYFSVKKENLMDVAIIGMSLGTAGGRIYYVVFNFSQFSNNLWEIFNLRTGGLAIYGSIIFSFLFSLIYCKRKKISFLPICDVCGFGLLIGQGIGRWGNFFNVEAYGTKTNLPWGMCSSEIDFKNSPVHPTFFYESLWCFLGILVLMFFLNKRKFNGEIFLIYVAWYSFGRFFIETIRTDSLWLIKDFVRVSQLLSFILFFSSVGIIFYILFFYIKRNKKSSLFSIKTLKNKK